MIKLKPESEDMLHLDALRFFASVAIVYFHWQDNLLPIHELSSFHGDFRFLPLAVDLFFTISGIVMFQVYFRRLSSLEQFSKFVQRRIARLYPLHLLTLLIMVIFGLLIQIFHIPGSHPENYDFRGIIPNLLLLQSWPILDHLTFNSPSWSISAEMFCYLLLPGILFLFRWRWWSTAAVGVLGIILLTVSTHGLGWMDWTFSFGFLRALPSFLFGVTIGGSDKLLRRIPSPNIFLFVVTCALLALGLMGSARGLLMILVYLVAVFAFAADVHRIVGTFTRFFAPFGTLTYSIYMIHRLVQAFVFKFILRKLHLNPWLNNLSVISSFLLLMFIAYWSYLYIEMPARRWISSLGQNSLLQKNSALQESSAPIDGVIPRH